MRISDWSSDVCSSDLTPASRDAGRHFASRVLRADRRRRAAPGRLRIHRLVRELDAPRDCPLGARASCGHGIPADRAGGPDRLARPDGYGPGWLIQTCVDKNPSRSEEHTSELQSLMRISYAV